MKARVCPIVLSVALGFLGPPAARAAETVLTHAFVDPADPAVLAIRRLGESTLDRAGVTLQLEVRKVLADSTPPMAIGKLHLKDYQLPPAAPGKPAVTELRRTSLRVRNPANAPDAADRAALELIKEQRDQGDSIAKVLVQKITQPGQPVQWRVYRPMGVMTQCLLCHGTPDAIAPGVHDALQVFYPRDTAVDYREGDWRGLMRVTIVVPVEKK